MSPCTPEMGVMWRLDEAQCGEEVGSPGRKVEDGLTWPGSLRTGTINAAAGGHPRETLTQSPQGLYVVSLFPRVVVRGSVHVPPWESS